METNDDLMEEIQASIKKNLSQQVGEELKKVLEKGKADAAKVKHLTDQSIDLNRTIHTLNEKLTEYAKLDERNKGLEEREKKVIEDERDIKLKTFEYQLGSEKEKTQFAKEVALGLVRNTEYRKSTFDTTNQAGYSNGNNWVQPNPIQESHSETSEAK